MLYLQWPQTIWIVLVLIGLGVTIAKHGQPYSYPYSIWTFLVRTATSVVLLAYGGFFSPSHAQVPPEAARYRAELTRAAHSQWGLGAPVAALAAQVHQESAWNPQAVSQVGAAGLAQFMPATARWWCDTNGIGLAQCQPKNPTWALRALVGYDKYLFDRAPTRYTDRDRMHVALRAYNGGLGHWRAEAKASGLPQPTVDQVAAACGLASRHLSHCRENLGYPARILGVLQPRYATWGKSL